MSNTTYVGWIPCVNGHLDFGLTKVGINGGFTQKESKDRNHITINASTNDYKDSHARRIVMQSWVDWMDSEGDGKFRVFVTGNVVESSCMDERLFQGHILIYPLFIEPGLEIARKKINAHEACHKLSQLYKSADSLAQEFSNLENIVSGKTKLIGVEDSGFMARLSFKVYTNGITELQYVDETQLSDEGNSRYVIARQAFYYLKYSSHTHKHHFAQQDSLTTIVSIDSSESRGKKNAGLQMLCQLKRELTSLKKMQNHHDRIHPTNNALGIISYMKSLLVALEETNYLDKHVAEVERFRLQNTACSFEAQNQKIESRINTLEVAKQKAKAVIGIFLVTLWGTCNYFLGRQSLSLPDSTVEVFYSVPIVGLVLCVSIYFILRRWYTEQLESNFNEDIYYLSSKEVWVKLVLGALASLTLIGCYILTL